MEIDNLIEVLQGVKAGRKAQASYSGRWESIDSFRKFLDAVQRYDIRLEPLPDEIMFNGVMIPAPLRVAPARETTYYIACPSSEEYQYSTGWVNDEDDKRMLARSLVHLTPEAAAKQGKAMCTQGVE